MNALFLFVRPPRPRWPFNGPATSYWPPLAFASMAAMLRQRTRDWRVEIFDAPALQMGWRSLESELRRRQPAVIAMGEEAVSCAECLRLARLGRALGATLIAGGCFFGHVAPQVLRTGLVDIVAHGEGELTVVELARALHDGAPDALAEIAGISFVRDGEVRRTPARQPIPDLDTLPMPAWDLLSMQHYGAGSRNHPGLAAIEASRGCIDACKYCVLWRQMGHFVAGQPRPHLRVKPTARLLEEVRVQTREFGRRHLGWVNPCFNAHPRVAAELCEALLRDGIEVGQSAWVRADCLARDHPRVFTLGTFIYGLPGDTPATVRAIFRLSHELELDHAFFIPLTPLPGAPYWNDDLWDDSGERLRDFSFLPAAARPGARRGLEWALMRAAAFEWTPARLRSYWRNISSGGARKRRVALRLAGRSTWFALHDLLRGLLRGERAGMIFPRWYES